MVPFGRILVLAVYYFLLKFYLKSVEKLDFAALVELWFWCCLFSQK